MHRITPPDCLTDSDNPAAVCPRLGPGPCITSCYMHSNKRFAFLEFRSAEEANNCMAFDGIIWGTDNLKVSSRGGEPDRH